MFGVCVADEAVLIDDDDFAVYVGCPAVVPRLTSPTFFLRGFDL